MTAILFTALFLSLDSLVVASAVSPLIQTRARRLYLATLFGVFDGLAVLLGSIVSVGGNSVSRALPFLILSYGAYCLVAAHWNRFRVNPRLAYVLPILLSVDNLMYGVGSGLIGSNLVVQAVMLGLTSFVLASLGLLVGDAIRFSNRRAAERCAGFAMVIVCLALFLM